MQLIKTLLVILFLSASAVKAQITNKSGGYITIPVTAGGGIYIGGTTTVSPMYDTIKCIMLVSDTTHRTDIIWFNNHPMIKWNTVTFWIMGYNITTNWRIHCKYLDEYMKPLVPGIIVWQSQTTK